MKIGDRVITYENLKATVVLIENDTITLMYDKLDRDCEILPIRLMKEVE